MRQCGVDSLFLNFVNYCRTEEELLEMLAKAATPMVTRTDHFSLYLGFGPADGDVLCVEDYSNDIVDAMPKIVQRWRDARALMTGVTKPATNWIGGVPSFASAEV